MIESGGAIHFNPGLLAVANDLNIGMTTGRDIRPTKDEANFAVKSIGFPAKFAPKPIPEAVEHTLKRTVPHTSAGVARGLGGLAAYLSIQGVVVTACVGAITWPIAATIVFSGSAVVLAARKLSK